MKRILLNVILPSALMSVLGVIFLSVFPSRGHDPICAKEIPETFAICFVISLIYFLWRNLTH